MKRKGRITESTVFRKTLGISAAAAAGFLFSGTSVGGASAFADISLAGALEVSRSAAVFLGSLLFSFISGNIGHNIVKLAAMVLILIAKLLIEKFDPKTCGIYTAVSVFLAGTAVSAVIGELLLKLAFYVFYSLLSGITAFSASCVLSDIKHKHVIDLSFSGYCYAVVYTIYTASLCSINIPLLNIGVIIGAAATLIAAFHYGQVGGVMCGALTACAAFLTSAETGMTVVLLPAVGLLTGYLHRRREASAAIFFAAASVMLMILTGLTQNVIYMSVNILCGVLIFTAAEQIFSDKWVKLSSGSVSSAAGIMMSRMMFMSDTIGSVREDTDRIAEMLVQRDNDERCITEKIRRVCEKCYKHQICRRKGSLISEGFDKLSQMAEISAETFPSELDTCIRRNELISAHENAVQEETIEHLIEARYSDSRGLLCEQMKTIESILRYAGETPDIRKSETISRLASEKLEKFGYEPQCVAAYYNSSNRMTVEIYFSSENAPETSVRICDLISDELRKKLEYTEPISSGNGVRIRLFEKPRYSADVYGASVSADNSGENGDTSLAFSDGTGTAYVVLSDGMGSGRSAAFESRLVVRMFRKLINCGIDYGSAVKLINSVMLTKSKDESFATLDVIKIDLDTCGMMLIKSGAAATIIRHRGDVVKITAPTFPIGIYEKSEIFTADCEVDAGDIAIMFSDGINENEYLFIRELLLGGDDLKKIVDEICCKAGKFNPTLKADDVTVIGVKIMRN